MKKPVTWFLIADGARARIVVRPEGSEHYTVLLEEDALAAHARARELTSDRPGRNQESAYTAHHALAPRNDPHRLEEIKFIRSVAAHVNRESARGSFDRLVIYAAPRCLAQLRISLDAAAAKKLHGEHAKDLTRVPLAELPRHFAAD